MHVDRRMDIDAILNSVAQGLMSPKEARKLIGELSIADLGHTKIDLERGARTGFAEVVFCQGKTPQQIEDIFSEFQARGLDALGTRISEDAASRLRSRFPNAVFDKISRTAVLRSKQSKEKRGLIAIVSAGTSDMPVAEEARICAEFFGSNCQCFYDCGVAGLHRLTSNIDKIRKARVVIAVAGMEGALASVVAGLVGVPVIAVPTSVGYGASFGGLCALLSMVNSCANGVSVVNIDNGFGAAYIASMINLPDSKK